MPPTCRLESNQRVDPYFSQNQSEILVVWRDSTAIFATLFASFTFLFWCLCVCQTLFEMYTGNKLQAVFRSYFRAYFRSYFRSYFRAYFRAYFPRRKVECNLLKNCSIWTNYTNSLLPETYYTGIFYFIIGWWWSVGCFNKLYFDITTIDILLYVLFNYLAAEQGCW